jgi:hypothetical protein
LLHQVLITLSAALPLIYLIRALLQSESHGCSDQLFEDGILRIDRLDERNIIPLAFLTIVMIAIGTALIQSPVLRATLQFPLPLAPGRWVAAISTLSWPNILIRSRKVTHTVIVW